MREEKISHGQLHHSNKPRFTIPSLCDRRCIIHWIQSVSPKLAKLVN